MQDPDPPTVWMRSIRWHTYGGVPQPEGAYYLAHEPLVETITAVLRFAVQDVAPRQAVRTTALEAEPETPVQPAGRIRRGKVMMTTDLPTPPKTAA